MPIASRRSLTRFFSVPLVSPPPIVGKRRIHCPFDGTQPLCLQSPLLRPIVAQDPANSGHILGIPGTCFGSLLLVRAGYEAERQLGSGQIFAEEVFVPSRYLGELRGSRRDGVVPSQVNAGALRIPETSCPSLAGTRHQRCGRGDRRRVGRHAVVTADVGLGEPHARRCGHRAVPRVPRPVQRAPREVASARQGTPRLEAGHRWPGQPHPTVFVWLFPPPGASDDDTIQCQVTWPGGGTAVSRDNPVRPRRTGEYGAWYPAEFPAAPTMMMDGTYTVVWTTRRDVPGVRRLREAPVPRSGGRAGPRQTAPR
jgi:hypothetical protein